MGRSDGPHGWSQETTRAYGRRLGSLLVRLVLLSCLVAALPAEAARRVSIGIVMDGPFGWFDIQDRVRHELLELLEGEFEVAFPERAQRVADWTDSGARREVAAVLEDREVDVLVTIGPISSQAVGTRGPLAKPTIAIFAVSGPLQGLPYRDGRSGVRNLNYLESAGNLGAAAARFRQIVPFDHAAILLPEEFLDAVPGIRTRVAARFSDAQIEATVVPVGTDLDEAVARVPADADVAIVMANLRLTRDQNRALAGALASRRLPSLGMLGESELELGYLVGLTPEEEFSRIARRTALNVQRALLGEDPATFPVAFRFKQRVVINMATARRIGVTPSFQVLSRAKLLHAEAETDDPEWTLDAVAYESVLSNLDFLAEQARVVAAAEDVSVSRARLLPQLELRGSALQTDSGEQAVDAGLLPERAVAGTLGLSQIVLDESAWADFGAQKYMQEAREHGLETKRLDVVFGAVIAYVEVLRTVAFEGIRKENLSLTQTNLDVARDRRAIGAAGPAEVFRWENQIARDRQAVIRAGRNREVARVDLNAVLDHPLEERFRPREASIADLDLSFTDPRIEPFLSAPDRFAVLRDYLALAAIRNAPELMQVDAEIAAQERATTRARRVFFTPSVGAFGELTRRSLDRETGNFLSAPDGDAIDFDLGDDTDWFWAAGVRASLPLFSGGARFADLRQAKERVRALRLRRRLLAKSIERETRNSAFAASASFTNIALAEEGSSAAERTLEVVSDAYSKGRASILDLLDAQNAALAAAVRAADAEYDHLADIMSLSRAVGRFDFFLNAVEREEILTRLEAYDRLQQQAREAKSAP